MRTHKTTPVVLSAAKDLIAAAIRSFAALRMIEQINPPSPA
jgi:hypothetical protein